MSAAVAGWLIDTFFWTGVLIAMVLVLRRPVAKRFGPQVAYGLWVLPLVRFVMPPLILPASMAPVEPVVTSGEAVFITATPVAEAAAPSLAWVEPVLLTLWLGGAAVFLVMRVIGYRRMRAHLLAQARPVGEAGKVRLVETPGASAPVAFGLFDKVVALPPDFMAHYDRAARDLAIAHELAHHRGHDLLANFAAQPVLALHWFNPLAWWGWRALRSDQEAACDARVMAGASRGQRAAYAEVIAGFARGNDFVLAAPMACPVLGEKSIVHRLRSLTMTESSKARRLAGVAIIALGAFALPLTASVSYASPPEPPAAPMPPEAPLVPAPPEVPLTPPPPAAPVPPMPPEALFLPAEFEGVEGIEAEVAAAIAEARADRVEALAEQAEARAEAMEARAEAMAARAEAQADAAEARAEAQAAAAEARAEARAAAAEARAEARSAARLAMVSATVVEDGCEGDDLVSESRRADGRTVWRICHDAVARQASQGLQQARTALASQPNLPAKVRAEALRNIDREIERIGNPHRLAAVTSNAAVFAVASAQSGAPPVAFISRPGAVTATLRFVSGEGAPQVLSFTIPVSFGPIAQTATGMNKTV
ncbi:M56 family metallopeptidase [Aurantiacibacter suaedae]|uniref:M56 family metallopeptidase n=1 Tax=Aurantiacibacter suaedae TaxID=2545755 RepID=UPI0010F49A0D|nr:M56 family metallopeptidase [Aurantiacibacter suaedae]